MTKPIKVLLQTTIPAAENDWGIERFSLLHGYLAELKNAEGKPLFEVTGRNKEADSSGNDPVLSTLNQSDFDEVWLFAVDVGDGLSDKDCEGINAFYRQGGGLLITRDHQDLGSSLCAIERVGAAQYFKTKNPDPDPDRCGVDDTFTPTISWPNYHSGKNGDYQQITVLDQTHPLLANNGSGTIELFPAHPHEGSVGIPSGETQAKVIATGKSIISGRSFNLAVAFDSTKNDKGEQLGRAIAESSFHHFADYNWNPAAGAPTFVTETPGDSILTEPRALADIHTYVKNAAIWLAKAE